MGPRGKKVMEKFLAQTQSKGDPPVEIDKNYLLTWNMPKATQLTIQRGYIAFKERFSKTAHSPLDQVFFQLENAYLKAEDKMVHTTLSISGIHISALFVVLGMMLDQEFINDNDAEELEKCLLGLFDSIILA